MRRGRSTTHVAQHAACDQRTQIVAWVAQLIALMVRYRGSHAALRRQYRWVLWSMGFVVRAGVGLDLGR
jgi:hypothetical protein